MQNNYRHLDDGTTCIEVKNSSGETLDLIIDTEDFEMASSIPGIWSVWIRNDCKTLPTIGTTSFGRKNPKYLQRMITDCPKGKVVYNISRNFLDLRKKNLLVANVGETNSKTFMAKVEQLMVERQLNLLEETEPAKAPETKKESPVPQPNSLMIQEIKTYVIKNGNGDCIVLNEDEFNALRNYRAV